MKIKIEIPCRQCQGFPYGNIKGWKSFGVFVCGTCGGTEHEYFSVGDYLKWKLFGTKLPSVGV